VQVPGDTERVVAVNTGHALTEVLCAYFECALAFRAAELDMFRHLPHAGTALAAERLPERFLVNPVLLLAVGTGNARVGNGDKVSHDGFLVGAGDNTLLRFARQIGNSSKGASVVQQGFCRVRKATASVEA
jgi:hypothetical protein